MADEAIGRFDHIGIAVHSIDAARSFFEDALGAKFRSIGEHTSGDFRIALFDLHDFCIELLEPINPDGFLAQFLEKRGEGFHHLTLQTPELEKKVDQLESQGIKVVDKSFADSKVRSTLEPTIEPRSAMGCSIRALTTESL